MKDEKPNFERCSKNTEELRKRIEVKFYRLINYFERDDLHRFEALRQEIQSKQEMFLMRQMKKLNPIVRQYVQALLPSERNLDQWSKLTKQSLFYRPYLEIGRHYQNRKESLKADEYYNKCHQKFDKNDEAYHYLGKLELERGNNKEGLNLLKQGLEINEFNINILRTLAGFYEKQKRWNVANKYYQNLLNIEPNNQFYGNKLEEIVQNLHSSRALISNPTIDTDKAQPVRQIPKYITSPKSQKPIVNSGEKTSDAFRQIQEKIKVQVRNKQIKYDIFQKSIAQVKLQNLMVNNLKAKKEETHVGNKRQKMVMRKHKEDLPKTNSIPFEQLSAGERTDLQRLLQIDPLSEEYWKLIEFCQLKNLCDLFCEHLEQLIRNSKSQASIIYNICVTIFQMVSKNPQINRRGMHLLSVLGHTHRRSIFVSIFETQLCIMKEDRQKAKECSESSKLAIFVDKTMTKWQHREVLENYLFLMHRLIECENIDLLSLVDHYEAIILLSMHSFDKSQLDISQYLREMALLKNVLVSSKHASLTSIICLVDISDDTLIRYSNEIFIQEDAAYIALDQKQMRKHLTNCDNVIIFPSSLTFITECIRGLKRRLKIFVIQAKDSAPEDKAYIQFECEKLNRNGLTVFTSIPMLKIVERLQQGRT